MTNNAGACPKHPDWGAESCLPCLEGREAAEVAALHARIAELEAGIANAYSAMGRAMPMTAAEILKKLLTPPKP